MGSFISSFVKKIASGLERNDNALDMRSDVGSDEEEWEDAVDSFIAKKHGRIGDLLHGENVIKVERNFGNIIIQSDLGSTIAEGRCDCATSEETTMDQLKKIIEKQQKLDEKYFLFGSTASSEIPQVYPRLVESSLLQRATSNKEFYSPTPSQASSKYIHDVKAMSFDDVLSAASRSRFISVVGLPGAGKSMLSRQFTEHFNGLCILIKCMQLNFDPKDKLLTLQQLLLDYNYPQLGKKFCTSAYNWIIKNEEKCLIVIDGYDQANWNLVERPPVVRYEEPQLVWNLISNLCIKNYLHNCHVIFTSRPHSMTTMPKSIQPDYIIHVREFTFEDTKTLFHAFAGSNAETLWKTLQTKAPQLISLCQNPLMNQLIIKACLNCNATITDVSTMTQIFKFLIFNLRVCKNISCDDIFGIIDKLALLAYNATSNMTVMMTTENLKEVGLTSSTVQDLVIAEHTYTKGSCKVFEGEERLFFLHQTVQEFLTARHICMAMTYSPFLQFVKTKLFVSHWTVVRHFLYGIAFGMKSRSESHQKKLELLKSELIQRMAKNPSGRDLIELCCDVRESSDDDITDQAAVHFTSGVLLSFTFLSSSDTHALSLVLRRVGKRLKGLYFEGCNLKSESFRFIVEAIRGSEGSVDFVDITGNCLSSDDVQNICLILQKVNIKLDMWRCFEDGAWKRYANCEEMKIIQNKLDSIINTNLEVRVKFGVVGLRKNTST